MSGARIKAFVIKNIDVLCKVSLVIFGAVPRIRSAAGQNGIGDKILLKAHVLVADAIYIFSRF
jgi:hypothetical protein